MDTTSFPGGMPCQPGSSFPDWADLVAQVHASQFFNAASPFAGLPGFPIPWASIDSAIAGPPEPSFLATCSGAGVGALDADPLVGLGASTSSSSSGAASESAARPFARPPVPALRSPSAIAAELSAPPWESADGNAIAAAAERLAARLSAGRRSGASSQAGPASAASLSLSAPGSWSEAEGHRFSRTASLGSVASVPSASSLDVKLESDGDGASELEELTSNVSPAPVDPSRAPAGAGPSAPPLRRDSASGELPRRPCNGFMIYSNTFRKRFAAEYPDLANTEISAMLGKTWKALPKEEKDRYAALAQEAKEEFEKMYPGLRFKNKMRRPKKRKSEELDAQAMLQLGVPSPSRLRPRSDSAPSLASVPLVYLPVGWGPDPASLPPAAAAAPGLSPVHGVMLRPAFLATPPGALGGLALAPAGPLLASAGVLPLCFAPASAAFEAHGSTPPQAAARLPPGVPAPVLAAGPGGLGSIPMLLPPFGAARLPAPLAIAGERVPGAFLGPASPMPTSPAAVSPGSQPGPGRAARSKSSG